MEQSSNAKGERGKEALVKDFYQHFTVVIKDLNEKLHIANGMDTPSSQRRFELDLLADKIQDLHNAIQDIADDLPSHDKAQYSREITHFREKLQLARDAGVPKKKFSFGAGKKVKLPTQPGAEFSGHVKESPATTPAPSTPAAATKKFPGLECKDTTSTATSSSSSLLPNEDDYLSYKHLLSDVTSNGVLANFQHSIIDTRHPNNEITSHHSTLAIRNIKDSLLILGTVAGATHVTGLKNSILLVETAQLRMHECKDVDVYLNVASRPIIEDSTGIRFAPFPSQAFPTKPPKSTLSLPPLIINENKWDQVDDFNHLKQTQSPNWSIIPQEKRLDEGVWTETIRGDQRHGLTDILAAVGIRNAERGRNRRGSEACGQGPGF